MLEDQALPVTSECHDAWTWRAPGAPDRLVLRDEPAAMPGVGEVLVANSAIGINPVDWKVMERGHPSWQPGHVPGVDGAGRIAVCGSGANLPLGLRVAYHQGLAQGGSFAAFTRIAAKAVIPVPDAVPDVIAAAIPCPAMTALQALDKIPAAANRDVLVTGAGGAVGSLIAQLALARGWRTWATAGQAHHARLASYGVSSSFDYAEEGWAARLDAMLRPRRLYAVFDTVGPKHAAALADLVAYNGHLVCIQGRIESPPLPVFSSAISLHEVALNSVHEHASDREWQDWRRAGAGLFRQVASGQLLIARPRVLPFSELPRGIAEMRDGAGKTVIEAGAHHPNPKGITS